MRPLNNGKDVNGNFKRIAVDENEIYRDYKGSFEATRSQLKSGQFGPWAKFVGINGLGSEASFASQRTENDLYRFQSIDTEFFYLDPSYITKSMKLCDVEEYMEATKYKKGVYLVTGIKVAKGVAVRLCADIGAKAKLELGVFRESSDIVVGIQCLKIYYTSTLSRGHGKRKEIVFTDGATFLGDDVKEKDESEDLVQVRPEHHKPRLSTSSQLTEDGAEEFWMLPEG